MIKKLSIECKAEAATKEKLFLHRTCAEENATK